MRSGTISVVVGGGVTDRSRGTIMAFSLPKIYPITDVKLSGLSHGEQVARLIDGGASLIQLREKYASPLEFYESAIEAIKIARESNCRIIINDRVDLALALKADGVHLGQDDLAPEHARRLLGNDAIIGLSTHSLEQALAAIELPIDYIALGPIFATQTKGFNSPPAGGGVAAASADGVVGGDAVGEVGLEVLENVRLAVGDFPLVAIGGIDSTNLQNVFAAGTDSAAMISALLSDAGAISKRYRSFSKVKNDVDPC